MLAEGSGLTAGRGLPPGLQPGAGADRPGLRRPAPLPQARRRHRRGVRPARRRVLRGRARLRRPRGPAAPERRLGPRLRPRPPSWPSSPRPPTATSTSGWPTSSPGSPTRSASTSRRSSRPATPSPTATSTSPASRSAGTASRSTRGCTCGTTRRPPSCARPARPTPRCPRTPWTCSPPPSATWTGVGGAGAGRRLPGRGQGDRVLRRLPDAWRRCAARRRAVRVGPDVHGRGTDRARAAAARGPAGHRRDRAGRPRRVPRRWPPPTCRASRCWWTAAGSPTRPTGRACAAS